MTNEQFIEKGKALLKRAYDNNNHDMGWDLDYQELMDESPTEPSFTKQDLLDTWQACQDWKGNHSQVDREMFFKRKFDITLTDK